MHLTQSEEMLIQKSCDQSWSGAECKLVQSRILATKTDVYGRKHRTLQKEWGFDLQESASRRLVSAELCRSSPDSVAVHPPDVSCLSGASPTESAEGLQHVQTVGQSSVQGDSRTLEEEEIVFFCCTMAGLDAESRQCEGGPGCETAWRDEKPNF